MDNRISIIIPTLNEEHTLESTIHLLRRRARINPFEIIIVDATTPNIRKRADGATILHSPKGRAIQMNRGSQAAKGDILLFLHADTILPHEWDTAVTSCINNGADAGGFYKSFDNHSFLLKLNASWCNARSKLFKSLLGDNAIFVKRKTFEKIGGYKEIPLMEDVEFSKSLRKYRVKIITKPLITSSRRFTKNGTLKTLLLMAWIRLRYLLGTKPEKLAKIYRK